ncbi:unnamed protein product [Periconia digitata]|uniref:Nucleolar protein 9 n=1 Tax=Periconia digitata TaxID=1303443 RepID=A0A9W4XNV5_9PLEO|nr:unnamed protein product [Periconia digitata]
MPKENRKRGRREEAKKRKRDHDDHDAAPKRHKQTSPHHDPTAAAPGDDEQHVFQDDAIGGATHPGETPFYGMLDEEEQEYFKKADELLELNDFDGPEGRALFLQNVYKEANGKELKIAHSQSCSRLMERLILLSSPQQLKDLFQKFTGEFIHLVHHRFASHCCETLFIRAAHVVTEEHTKPDLLQTPPSSDPNEIFVTMEDLFLHTLDELVPYLSFYMTNPFASHVLRLLLVVLSGAPLEKENLKSALHSKRKEKINVPGADNTRDYTLPKRQVPQSFLDALEKIINDGVASQDSSYLHLLATHPTGNPTLQTLLKLELTQFGKSRARDEKSLIRRLLPDDPIKEGTESASFINGLVYDTIGSRLLETIIENAPGKLFKAIYSEFFKQRMGSLSRNEIASYVAGKVLERLGKDDLEEAMRQIAEQIPGLVERNRTSIIKTLIERCVVRGVNTTPIKNQLETAYKGANGFELSRMLKLGEGPADDGKTNHKHEQSSPDKIHGSLLAQAMLAVPGSLSKLIFDSFLNLGEQLTVRVARSPTASRTLQAALTSPNASLIFRRKVIQQLYGHIGELALDPAGSHAIDAVWKGTQGLAFIRERVAEELAENEGALRESHVGRAVWRNWQMDLYKRRRSDWVQQARYTAGNDGFQSFPEQNDTASPFVQSQRANRHMSAIELARRKHAEAKAAMAKKEALENKKEASHSRNEGGDSVAAH